MGRRSAQGFDATALMPRAVFTEMLLSLMAGGSPVWQMWPTMRVHPVMLVHRVEGLSPGIYAMPRCEAAIAPLRAAFRDSFVWERISDDYPLFNLVSGRAAKMAKTLSCHQSIASDCAVMFMMVAEFSSSLNHDEAAYRHLHWEAGMMGHVITLCAESLGWRGTGIGCYFDDADHEVLGIEGDAFQVIYHYAVGRAVDDARISTLPAYV